MLKKINTLAKDWIKNKKKKFPRNKKFRSLTFSNVKNALYELDDSESNFEYVV